MPHSVFIVLMHQIYTLSYCYEHTRINWQVYNREESRREKTEQHHCLSYFFRLYGNVLTTKAALHLHGLPVILLRVVCLCKCTWPKQIKNFHQDVIGGRVGGG